MVIGLEGNLIDLRRGELEIAGSERGEILSEFGGVPDRIIRRDVPELVDRNDHEPAYFLKQSDFSEECIRVMHG